MHMHKGTLSSSFYYIFTALQLRLLWCSSPHATAELFEELKVFQLLISCNMNSRTHSENPDYI